MKVQLVALVFALTLYACTRTQITLSGAAVGPVLRSLVRLELRLVWASR